MSILVMYDRLASGGSPSPVISASHRKLIVEPVNPERNADSSTNHGDGFVTPLVTAVLT